MKYLSLFSGIGGFELGIQQAYGNKEERCKVCEDFYPTDSTGRCGTCAYEFATSGRQEQSELEHESFMADFASKRTEQSSITCVGYSEIDKYAIQIYQSHFPNHENFGDITKINEKELPDFDLLVGGFPCQAFSIAGKRAGFADTRGTLFFDIARILKEKRPRLLLLENVKGLLSHDNGRTFKVIISTLDELGYDLQWQVLNSKNHGVPQNRERVFIVGHLRGTPRPKVFPFGENAEISLTKKSIVSRGISVEFKEGDSSDTTGKLFQNGEDRPVRVRRLTPLECERLQGFPDNWTASVSDTQRYKTLGNAVTVNVIRDIMEKLLVSPITS